MKLQYNKKRIKTNIKKMGSRLNFSRVELNDLKVKLKICSVHISGSFTLYTFTLRFFWAKLVDGKNVNFFY